MKSEIENITTHYASRHDVWENLTNLEEIIEQHGEQAKFLFIRKLSQIKNFMLLCENKKFAVEIPSKKEDIFLRELSKTYMKVIIRTKLTAPLQNDNEIMFTVIVYK